MMNVLEKIAGLYRPGLFKFILFLCILVNLGIIQGIHHVMLMPSDGLPEPERREKSQIVMNIVRELYFEAREKAESNGGCLSPHDYFHVLTEILLKEKELGFHPFGVKVGAKHAVNIYIRELQDMSNKGINDGIFSMNDLEDAKREYKKECLGKFDSLDEPTPDIWSMLKGLFGWLWMQYLLNSPIGALSLLIIFRDEQEEFKFFKGIETGFRSPFRFALMTLLYPVVLGKVLYWFLKTKGDRIYLEAQLRRAKKDIFDNLTKDELASIERFLRERRPLSLWKSMLSARGLSPRHGFATAVAATLVLMVLSSLIIINPRVCEAGSLDSDVTVMNQSVRGSSSQIDCEDDGNGSWDIQDCISNFLDFVLELFVQAFFPLRNKFCPQSYHHGIEHVPKSCYLVGGCY